MPSTVYSVSESFTAANRIQFTTDTDIQINNPSDPDYRIQASVRYEITTTTAIPAIDPKLCAEIQRGKSKPLQMKAGEYLFLAADTEFEISVTQ